MYMKKLLFALFVGVFCTLGLSDSAQAQGRADYRTSVGVRLSNWYGASLKHFVSGSDALEGILQSSWGAVKITGLYERHTLAFDEPGLKFYYGGGAHIGFAGGSYLGRWDYYNNNYQGDTRVLLGLDGVLGLEYTFQDQNVPLNISLDWKPAFDLAPRFFFGGAEVGLTARYIFRY